MLIPENFRKSIMWFAATVIALLVLAFFLLPKPPTVRTEKAFRGNLVLMLSTTGYVDGDLLDVSSRISGKLDKIPVSEGQKIGRGDIVAILDTSELRDDVASARAVLQSAQAKVQVAEKTLAVETKQVNADIARSRALLAAVQARLADLKAGARSQEIKQAQAQLDLALAQLKNARIDLRSDEKLFASGAISRTQLEDARTTAQVAAASVKSAQENLALVKSGSREQLIKAANAEEHAAEASLAQSQASRARIKVRESEVLEARAQANESKSALDAAKTRLSYAIIRSPVDGTVARVYPSEGENVSQQQAIVTMLQNSRIWVTAEVDQEDVAAIELGQVVHISLEAFPGRYALGKITRIAVTAIPKEVGRVRAKIVRVHIDLTESTLPLKPGLEVDIDGKREVAKSVVLVSNDAVLHVGNSDYVFVIEDGRAYRRKVIAGSSSFDYTIMEHGVKAGEEVAVTNVDKLSDGERVRVSP